MEMIRPMRFRLIIHRLFIVRKSYDFSPLFDSVVEGDFCAAFSGGCGALFVVIDYAIFTFIYHLKIAFDVGGFSCVVKLFGVIGVVI